jgi:hypothetical protein
MQPERERARENASLSSNLSSLNNLISSGLFLLPVLYSFCLLLHPLLLNSGLQRRIHRGVTHNHHLSGFFLLLKFKIERVFLLLQCCLDVSYLGERVFTAFCKLDSFTEVALPVLWRHELQPCGFLIGDKHELLLQLFLCELQLLSLLSRSSRRHLVTLVTLILSILVIMTLLFLVTMAALLQRVERITAIRKIRHISTAHRNKQWN